jgi:hypothetical protein
MNVDRSDLLKILDVLKANENFQYNRDKMNAAVHWPALAARAY